MLVFRGRPVVEVEDADGRAVRTAERANGTHSVFEFEGRGRFRVHARQTH